MSQYLHSIVLFSGDDGLPIEFNIQNTVEKMPLKSMIEHGGGMCTHSADAICLVSPGTTVINIATERKIISSRFIFDCVKQNYLLDMDDYKVEINEVEADDFSEEISIHLTEKEPNKSSEEANSVEIIDPNKTVSPIELACPKSNHAFDFEDTSNVEPQKVLTPPSSPILSSQTNENNSGSKLQISTTPEGLNTSDKVHTTDFRLQISTTPERFGSSDKVQNLSNSGFRSQIFTTPERLAASDKGQNLSDSVFTPKRLNASDKGQISSNSEYRLQICTTPEKRDTSNKEQNSSDSDFRLQISTTPKRLGIFERSQKNSDDNVQVFPNSVEDGQNFGVAEEVEVLTSAEVSDNNNSIKNKSSKDSPINTVIVSSSQPGIGVLDQFDNMIMNKVHEKPAEQEDQSLSQSYTVSSSADAQLAPSTHDTSAEIFGGDAAALDSQTSERQLYIKNLEKEIEKILQKPSPKSIQDKIILVKYISCVKTLAPAIVLQTLQNF